MSLPHQILSYHFFPFISCTRIRWVSLTTYMNENKQTYKKPKKNTYVEWENLIESEKRQSEEMVCEKRKSQIPTESGYVSQSVCQYVCVCAWRKCCWKSKNSYVLCSNSQIFGYYCSWLNIYTPRYIYIQWQKNHPQHVRVTLKKHFEHTYTLCANHKTSRHRVKGKTKKRRPLVRTRRSQELYQANGNK